MSSENDSNFHFFSCCVPFNVFSLCVCVCLNVRLCNISFIWCVCYVSSGRRSDVSMALIQKIFVKCRNMRTKNPCFKINRMYATAKDITFRLLFNWFCCFFTGFGSNSDNKWVHVTYITLRTTLWTYAIAKKHNRFSLKQRPWRTTTAPIVFGYVKLHKVVERILLYMDR